jgi:hypothetical protein
VVGGCSELLTLIGGIVNAVVTAARVGATPTVSETMETVAVDDDSFCEPGATSEKESE